MGNKFIRRLALCIDTIKINLKWEKEIIEKEEKENGIFPQYTKDIIGECLEIITKLDDKYKNIGFSNNDIDVVKKDIYTMVKIHNARNKDLPAFNYEFERDNLPAGMLDAFMSFVCAINYCTEYLKLTLEREGIDKEFKTLEEKIKPFVKFIEEDLLLDVREDM